ncbi:hypothetical protein KC338_g228 [Hortaea werneckii]|nr:hypothetical protein KC338_g228 [Hortaea werneckii]
MRWYTLQIRLIGGQLRNDCLDNILKNIMARCSHYRPLAKLDRPVVRGHETHPAVAEKSEIPGEIRPEDAVCGPLKHVNDVLTVIESFPNKKYRVAAANVAKTSRRVCIGAIEQRARAIVIPNLKNEQKREKRAAQPAAQVATPGPAHFAHLDKFRQP